MLSSKLRLKGHYRVFGVLTTTKMIDSLEEWFSLPPIPKKDCDGWVAPNKNSTFFAHSTSPSDMVYTEYTYRSSYSLVSSCKSPYIMSSTSSGETFFYDEYKKST